MHNSLQEDLKRIISAQHLDGLILLLDLAGDVGQLKLVCEPLI
jgi:hypothetical protein